MRRATWRSPKIYAALASVALASPSIAQTSLDNEEITVTGERIARSDWSMAETNHVVVLSNGKTSELIRIASNLERLHYILDALLNRLDQPDITTKLQITLIGNPAEFTSMRLHNMRSQEGPFTAAFRSSNYYDPREGGAVLAASRFDQVVTLQKGLDLGSFLQSSQLTSSHEIPAGMDPPPQAAGLSVNPNPGLGSIFIPNNAPNSTINSMAVELSADGRIYAAYARHYLLTHVPHAYPRWYVDGFGELFATLTIRSDGQIEFGRGPSDYTRVLNHHLSYPVGKVITGANLTDKDALRRWTPYHAWVLTHMLFFNDTRRDQLRAYLAKVASGHDLATASEAFGDLGQLNREVAAYDNRKIDYVRLQFPASRAVEPIVRQLTVPQAAFVKGALELGTRILLPEIMPQTPPSVIASALASRDRWLQQLRSNARAAPKNLDAHLLLAEAECRSDNPVGCREAAQRALSLHPNNYDALAWLGSARIAQAKGLAAAEKAREVREARALIAQAVRRAPENPIPLILYYRSFGAAGETAPEAAVEGLMKAVDLVPSAPGQRLLLGEALAAHGAYEAARRTLLPITHGASSSPERSPALAILASLPPDS